MNVCMCMCIGKERVKYAIVNLYHEEKKIDLKDLFDYYENFREPDRYVIFYDSFLK